MHFGRDPCRRRGLVPSGAGASARGDGGDVHYLHVVRTVGLVEVAVYPVNVDAHHAERVTNVRMLGEYLVERHARDVDDGATVGSAVNHGRGTNGGGF